jgi:hypothetical protein
MGSRGGCRREIISREQGPGAGHELFRGQSRFHLDDGSGVLGEDDVRPRSEDFDQAPSVLDARCTGDGHEEARFGIHGDGRLRGQMKVRWDAFLRVEVNLV